MPKAQKMECSIILIDLSGFTELLYQADHTDAAMDLVIKAVKRLFERAGEAAGHAKDIEIINNTGDGFLAIARGRTPSRTAMAFARTVEWQFDQRIVSLLGMLPFRQKVDLRIGLHHGTVHKMTIPGFGRGLPIYIGDDINLLARVVNSQTARRFGIAVTRAFFKRLTLGKSDPIAHEVIVDRNRYPEQLEVFRVPKNIPDYPPKK